MALLAALARPRLAAPGGALLHPVLLLALLTLIINDHVLKVMSPGALSGKLSDFAGVVVLPVFLHGLLELGCSALGRPLRSGASQRALALVLLASCLMFALPEVWEPADRCYRYGLGALRYPLRWLWAFGNGHLPPRLQPVRATADVTDLLALPMALVAWRVARPIPASELQASAVSHST